MVIKHFIIIKTAVHSFKIRPSFIWFALIMAMKDVLIKKQWILIKIRNINK